MGYLHPGHASLIRMAARHADRVAVSIFVNPLQFGPGEDFERYPRDLDRDLHVASEAGAEFVFTPSASEIYPSGEPWIAVVPERGADVLCGRSRPGHFRGVLTVVAKLLGIFAPDVALFGQKDLQQLTLIRRMVADLDLPVRVESAPIVRDSDGLAMSSRNRHLSTEERRRALGLVTALRACAVAFAGGERDAAAFRRHLHGAAAAGVDIEYGEVVDPESLQPVGHAEPGMACVIAGRVGATRLIDNHVLGNSGP